MIIQFLNIDLYVLLIFIKKKKKLIEFRFVSFQSPNKIMTVVVLNFKENN